MTRPDDEAAAVVDLPRVRAALARLDALAVAHPELTSPDAQARLARDLPELIDGEPMPKKTEAVSLRMPEGTLARAESLVPVLQAEPAMRAVNVKRSVVLLEALLRGLDSIEAESEGNGEGDG